MNMMKLYVETDISEEFEMLWEAAGAGVNASAWKTQSFKRMIPGPLSPRQLTPDDFQAWLLP